MGQEHPSMNANFVCRMLGLATVLFLCSATICAVDPMDCVQRIAMPNNIPNMPASMIDVHISIGVHGWPERIDYDNADFVLGYALSDDFW
jgi:hypothetical protein